MSIFYLLYTFLLVSIFTHLLTEMIKRLYFEVCEFHLPATATTFYKIIALIVTKL